MSTLRRTFVALLLLCATAPSLASAASPKRQAGKNVVQGIKNQMDGKREERRSQSAAAKGNAAKAAVRKQSADFLEKHGKKAVDDNIGNAKFHATRDAASATAHGVKRGTVPLRQAPRTFRETRRGFKDVNAQQ